MSFTSRLTSISRYIPEVSSPESRGNISERLKWTFLVLFTFIVLGQIELFGLSSTSAAQLSAVQVILASSIGTILTAGIGPIVVASIVLQLLVGAGIIPLDMSKPESRKAFSALQKIFVVFMAFFEAYIFTRFGLLTPGPGMFFWVILQVAIGSIILMYLDEIVQKYGVGSGISLFIATGVAVEIVWTIFSPISALQEGLQLFTSGATFSFATGSGLLWSFFANLSSGFYLAFVNNLVPIIVTFLVFAMVVYFQGIHINIPITMGRGAGQFGRFPVKFLYVSNMPVILAVALFANIYLMSTLLANSSIPILPTIFQYLAKFTHPPTDFLRTLLVQGSFVGLGDQILVAIVYTVLLIIACIIFGLAWIQIANQDSDSVARQLQNSGMYLPGFRRDPRVVKGVLDKYIPTITILGAAFVGLLAGASSLMGAIGTGTGILLTVDIVYKFYEELAKEQLSDNKFLSQMLSTMKR